MGSRLGQRASKCACLVVPPLFRADSGTNHNSDDVGYQELNSSRAIGPVVTIF